MLDMSALSLLDRATANAVSRIAGACWSMTLSDYDAGVPEPRLRFATASAHNARPDDVWLDLHGVFGVATLAVGAAFVDALCDLFIPAWREESPASLPLFWRALLVATRLSAIAAFEAKIDVSKAGRNQDPRTRGPCVCGTISVGRISASLMMRLQLSGDRQNAIVLRGLDRGRRSGVAPEFPCRLSLPPRSLTFDEYTGLESGDWVLVAKIESGAVPMEGNIAGFGEMKLLADPTGELLVDNFKTIEALFMENAEPAIGGTGFRLDATSLDAAGQPQNAADAARRLAALPVKLDFQLKSRSFTLDELRELGPGSTFDLQVNLADPISILANGVAVGSGYLVQIDDTVGVQIAQWPSDRGSVDA